jgi:hypothetical protein
LPTFNWNLLFNYFCFWNKFTFLRRRTTFNLLLVKKTQEQFINNVLQVYWC